MAPRLVSQFLVNMMDTKTILYVEDDETLSFLTIDNLEQQKYRVVHRADGLEALQAFKDNNIDICLLDIMIPKLDGFSLASAIRKLDPHIPIIFLSARTLKEDRIKGLKLGGDDYLVKPFSIEELLLKIEIFLNRSKKTKPSKHSGYTVGRYSFDPSNYKLKSYDGIVNLTQKEGDLLKLFLDNKNQVLKREDILMALWGEDDYFMGRSLDVFISRLRKLVADQPSISIENLHGIGFRYND